MSLQSDNLIKFDDNNQIITTAYSLIAPDRIQIAKANPLRLYLAFNILTGSSTSKLYPVSNKSSQPIDITTGGFNVGWIAWEVNKHYGLCTCEWDLEDLNSSILLTVVEVLYGGK